MKFYDRLLFSCLLLGEQSRRMAGAFHQGRSSEMETMPLFANASVGTIIKTQNKNVIFLIVYPPM